MARFEITYIVTQFKETAAYEGLQTKVYLSIAGAILARLKEIGVSDDKLQQVSDDICEDLAATMFEIGKYQVPGAEIYVDILKNKLKEMAELKAKLKEMAELKAKLKKLDELEAKLKKMDELEANLKKMTELEARLKKMDELEANLKKMIGLEAKSDSFATEEDRIEKIAQKKEEVKDQALPLVEGVLSSDKILSIFNAADVEGILSPDTVQSILNAEKSASV